MVRVDTISPEEGVDQVAGQNTVMSYFGINAAWGATDAEQFPDFQKIREIMRYCPKGFALENIDAVIIFVNDNNIEAYSSAYGPYITAPRRGQPVQAAMIQAPAEEESKSDDVWNWAITHELGHTMARLQEEYEPILLWPYEERFRNIAKELYSKWHWFIANGYGIGNIGGDYGVWYWNGTVCGDDSYRPTKISLMGGMDSGTYGIQYGPVNTYHMQASFLTRMGTYPGIEPDDPTGFEWTYYPLESFKQDWGPERFK